MSAIWLNSKSKLSTFVECFASIMLAWLESAPEQTYTRARQVRYRLSALQKWIELNYRGMPLCVRREGRLLKHSQMRFNLADNVTWPLFWHLPVFSWLQASITGFAEAFSVKFQEAFNYVVCIVLFVLKKLVTPYQFNVDRNFPLVKMECCVVL